MALTRLTKVGGNSLESSLNFTGNIQGSEATFTGVVTASKFVGNIQGSEATIAGVVTATQFVGDGSRLSNLISGIGIQSSGSVIGTDITQLNFIGLGNTFSVSQNTATISIPGSRSITVGLREGSPISFPLTSSSFNIVSRTGFTTINITT